MSTVLISKRTHHTKTLNLDSAHIMGILNVTPDSFSDGGQFVDVDSAVMRAKQMIAEGARIIDIGGESTRPNASPVSIQQELDRVMPVIEALQQELADQLQDNIWLSIDTSTPEIMRCAVEAGVDIINDVRALKREGALQMAARLDVPVVLMHMRGEPNTMDALADYQDVIAQIRAELSERIEMALVAGIAQHHIIIDAGFGFAKKYPHHKTMLNRLDELMDLGYPMMFAISRKRFLGEVLTLSDTPAFMTHQPSDRDPIGMAAALLAIQKGARLIRTHNVAITRQAIALIDELAQDGANS